MTTAPPCGREIKTSHCSAVDHFFSAILITLRALQTHGNLLCRRRGGAAIAANRIEQLIEAGGIA